MGQLALQTEAALEGVRKDVEWRVGMRDMGCGDSCSRDLFGVVDTSDQLSDRVWDCGPIGHLRIGDHPACLTHGRHGALASYVGSVTMCLRHGAAARQAAWCNRSGCLYHLTREGWAKSAIDAFHQQRQALSRFSVAAVVLNDSVVDVVRRELRRLSPEVRISPEEVRAVLLHEVLKREVTEGEQAEQAAKRLSRVVNRALRERAPKATDTDLVVNGGLEGGQPAEKPEGPRECYVN